MMQASRPGSLFGLIPPTFAPEEDITGGGPAMAAPTPAAPFQWGAGGARMTPDAIAMRRKMAMQQSAAGMDFSPVQHWSQGAARVAQALVGNLENRRLDKAEAANSAYEQQILSSIAGTGGGTAASLQLLADPNLSDGARKAVEMQYQTANRAPPQPHYFEANNGDQYAIGPDGQPQKLFADPTPKIDWITAGNPDGTKTLIPMGPNGPLQRGGGPSISPPTAPVGKLTPIQGGAPSAGARTFP